MTNQIAEIAERIRALREIENFSQGEAADFCRLSLEEYQIYEAGGRDFPFSFLTTIAQFLKVDVVDLIQGDSPKLSTCCMVKRGKGLDIERRKAYDYKHLAFTFKDKLAEPLLVTVKPSGEEALTLNYHPGQEFVYLLEGEMLFQIGEISYQLSPGDSVYFNSAIPHGMKAKDNQTCQFLAVVVNEC